MLPRPGESTNRASNRIMNINGVKGVGEERVSERETYYSSV